jgi:hypothetical protein
MYDKENLKVTKLTRALKTLQGEFGDLQEIVDELKVEREGLQEALEH